MRKRAEHFGEMGAQPSFLATTTMHVELYLFCSVVCFLLVREKFCLVLTRFWPDFIVVVVISQVVLFFNDFNVLLDRVMCQRFAKQTTRKNERRHNYGPR